MITEKCNGKCPTHVGEFTERVCNFCKSQREMYQKVKTLRSVYPNQQIMEDASGHVPKFNTKWEIPEALR